MDTTPIELTSEQKTILLQVAKKEGQSPEAVLDRVIESLCVKHTPTAQVQTFQRDVFKGEIRIADDFDEWPEELARAFGMTHE